MDRGARQATVHRVTKSQTRLKGLGMHTLCKDTYIHIYIYIYIYVSYNVVQQISRAYVSSQPKLYTHHLVTLHFILPLAAAVPLFDSMNLTILETLDKFRGICPPVTGCCHLT